MHSTESNHNRQTADRTNSKHLSGLLTPSGSLPVSESPDKPYLRLQLGSQWLGQLLRCLLSLSASFRCDMLQWLFESSHPRTSGCYWSTSPIGANTIQALRIWRSDWTISSPARFRRNVSEKTGAETKERKAKIPRMRCKGHKQEAGRVTELNVYLTQGRQ